MKYSDNRIRPREMPLKPLREFSSMLAQENEYAESTGGIRDCEESPLYENHYFCILRNIAYTEKML